MPKRNTMFYSALLLTGANLALRMVSMGFQVYLSGQLGAAGVGLLQLTISVATLAMTAAMAGIRTTAMYLTAEEIGKNRRGADRVLSACFCYSFLCSLAVALAVYNLSPYIAEQWIGDIRTAAALRVFAAFLPVVCLGGVMSGYFTAAQRIRELVAVEVLEQLTSMVITVVLLTQWAQGEPGRSVCAVVSGSSTASLVTLTCLMLLRQKEPTSPKSSEPVASRLLRVAVPLAMADDLRMGISTVENLIVPRRLSLYPGSDPLSEYGQVCGMVFPVMMFPASILYSLAELLIPELSRCAAGNRIKRIRYLTSRSLRVALLYGLAAGGILYTAALPLGQLLYKSVRVGELLRRFSILVPMLYLDAVTDATIKGMGQQVACVRYNILTSFLDVAFLWILLPRYGLEGYFMSFFVTHALNFLLSIRRLIKVTGVRPELSPVLRALGAWGLALWVCSLLPAPQNLGGAVFLGGSYLVVFGLLSHLMGVWGRADLHWLRGLIRPVDKDASISL